MTTTSNEEQARAFLDLCGKNYEQWKKKYRQMQTLKKRQFSEDAFNDTVLKVHDIILKKGLADDTAKGMENYFFRAFSVNSLAELAQPYVKRNIDLNETDFNDAVENSYENTLYGKMLRDYMAERIIEIASEYPDSLSFMIFRIKYLMNMTYKNLKEITKVPNAKKRCLDVKKYVQNRITKEMLIQEFESLDL